MIELEEYEKFEKDLATKYPEMYENVYCGISISPGWYKIVDLLSQSIYSHYKWKIQQGKATEFPKVAQIKEKFGGLRFYTDGSDEYTSGLIRMAEAWCDNTCEQCGVVGTRRSGGWIRTLCDAHEAERQERLKQD
jgi:hypothetical protein